MMDLLILFFCIAWVPKLIQSIITFCYVLVCIMLIAAVLLQHYRSDTAKGSNSYFGGSGNKDFLYRTTKYLIAAFFSLALLHTGMRYHSFQQESESLPIPLKKSVKTQG